MIPTLHPGDFLWCRKKTLPRRGDIAMVKRSGDHFFVKRIVGMPGESLMIRQGRVFIDHKPLDEPYVPETAYLEPKPDQSFHLLPATYFVLGDARDDSLDSREFGAVPAEDLMGVALIRIWPPKLSL